MDALGAGAWTLGHLGVGTWVLGRERLGVGTWVLGCERLLGRLDVGVLGADALDAGVVRRDEMNHALTPALKAFFLYQLLGLLLKLLNGELAWSTQREVLKVLGIMGNQLSLSGSHCEGACAGSDSGQHIHSVDELPMDLWPSFAMSEDYYSTALERLETAAWRVRCGHLCMGIGTLGAWTVGHERLDAWMWTAWLQALERMGVGAWALGCLGVGPWTLVHLVAWALGRGRLGAWTVGRERLSAWELGLRCLGRLDGWTRTLGRLDVDACAWAWVPWALGQLDVNA
ncbi:hypothetical protein IFM89_010963 [Coptis chinensis]|uniref:Uncharacterized protein n=1 Tax=Coptis chinensis TaxID=261450 RepID=A0A835M5B6_9MAGN|nr:hypothetical protein IFM89_010963 [Coptis chinensis]